MKENEGRRAPAICIDAALFAAVVKRLAAWRRFRLFGVVFLGGAAMFHALPATLIAQSSPAAKDGIAADSDANPAVDGEQSTENSPVAELEQLLQSAVQVPAMQQEVTTVSGQQSTVGKSAAAVFVITREMIRRSGATCIPETLRMAPGVQVARVNSHDWVVTVRGFAPNDGFFVSNRMLLVLIDGRSIYTPFSGGVYWDVQDLLLDDVERIEVIRGPGATIWGANAVNGVINIITKKASDTQGGLVRVGGGTEESGSTSARLGGRIGANVHYRIYGKWFERDRFSKPQDLAPVGPAVDDWSQQRGGFRVDWTASCCDLVTVQGDVYEGRNGIINLLLARPDDEQVRGGNLLGRWTHTYGEDDDFSLQFYYDRADREKTFLGLLDQEFDTLDVEFRRHRRIGDAHNVVWGLGYRSVTDRLTPYVPLFFSLNPIERTYDVASGFVQDEITLVEDKLFLTLGAKLSKNDFTGFEVQPTARVLWSPESSWAAWAAVSRPVRTPARIEHDGRVGLSGVLFSSDFQAEKMLAYEIGFRQQPVKWFSWDATLFYHQYDDLISAKPLIPPSFPFSITTGNGNMGEGYGVETSAQVEMSSCWRVSGSYSYLQLQMHSDAETINQPIFNGQDIEQSSPHNQVYLTSSHDLAPNLELDVTGRYVDTLPFLAPAGRPNVPSYISLDVRLAWRPTPCWELAAVGQNLLESHHREFGQSLSSAEIARGVYGTITRTW